MYSHDLGYDPHSSSRRKMRRHRRFLRRPRFIPMEGLIPQRPRNEPRHLAVKASRKRYHPTEGRQWGTRSARWMTNRWQRINGLLGDDDL